MGITAGPGRSPPTGRSAGRSGGPADHAGRRRRPSPACAPGCRRPVRWAGRRGSPRPRRRPWQSSPSSIPQSNVALAPIDAPAADHGAGRPPSRRSARGKRSLVNTALGTDEDVVLDLDAGVHGDVVLDLAACTDDGAGVDEDVLPDRRRPRRSPRPARTCAWCQTDDPRRRGPRRPPRPRWDGSGGVSHGSPPRGPAGPATCGTARRRALRRTTRACGISQGENVGAPGARIAHSGRDFTRTRPVQSLPAGAAVRPARSHPSAVARDGASAPRRRGGGGEQPATAASAVSSGAPAPAPAQCQGPGGRGIACRDDRRGAHGLRRARTATRSLPPLHLPALEQDCPGSVRGRAVVADRAGGAVDGAVVTATVAPAAAVERTVTVNPPGQRTAVADRQRVLQVGVQPAAADGVPSRSSEVSGRPPARCSRTPACRRSRLSAVPSQASRPVGRPVLEPVVGAVGVGQLQRARVPVLPRAARASPWPPRPDGVSVPAAAPAGRTPSRAAWATFSVPSCAHETPMTS